MKPKLRLSLVTYMINLFPRENLTLRESVALNEGNFKLYLIFKLL